METDSRTLERFRVHLRLQAQMHLALAHAAAEHDHGMIEQRTVAIRRVAEATQQFLDRFSQRRAEDEHATEALYQAGRHGTNNLKVRRNHPYLAAGLFARPQPRRTRVALPQGAFPLPPKVGRAMGERVR